MKRVELRKLAVAALAVFVLWANQTRAQELVYEVSGILPEDATISGDYVGVMQPGDAWVARCLIDMSIGDREPGDPTIGDYRFGADGWGQITFSREGSDYYSDDVIGDLRVFIYNDFFREPDGVTYDIVNISLRSEEDLGNFFIASILNTTDLSTLASDALPSHPTAFSVNGGPNWGLFYGDPNGSRVSYFPDVDSPVTFRTVPEPSTITLFTMIGLVVAFVSWRTRKRT